MIAERVRVPNRLFATCSSPLLVPTQHHGTQRQDLREGWMTQRRQLAAGDQGVGGAPARRPSAPPAPG
ncbi:hypothetical protein HaLaN_12617 [Haematococcus lacustris]|uniref:Uncharacterized protein n=1 Tax=Haematococcus lacustris TaxID=44745 RepID=A0A699ZAH7_HAELA|nr:hypothetical protein HaLaN_12617 [Haematococcus lacustris]